MQTSKQYLSSVMAYALDILARYKDKPEDPNVWGALSCLISIERLLDIGKTICLPSDEDGPIPAAREVYSKIEEIRRGIAELSQKLDPVLIKRMIERDSHRAQIALVGSLVNEK